MNIQTTNITHFDCRGFSEHLAYQQSDAWSSFLYKQQSVAISGTDRLKVPTIYKAYVCKGTSPENMAFYGTRPPL